MACLVWVIAFTTGENRKRGKGDCALNLGKNVIGVKKVPAWRREWEGKFRY